MKNLAVQTSSYNLRDIQHRAQIANQAASSARMFRDESNSLRITLERWAAIFSNSPLVVMTALFVLASVMEIVFSWPMYQDMMSSIAGIANPMLSFLGACFIVAWGAYISHCIGKKLSGSLFEYEVFNSSNSSHGIPLAAAEEKTSRTARRDLWKGIGLGILLLFVVATVSWQRMWLIATVTGEDYSLLHKVLPVICVIVEMFTGIYVGYLLRRTLYLFRARAIHKRYLRERERCAYETNICYEYHHHAITRGEKPLLSKDISEALYRYEHRSHENDSYIDPINHKTMKVKVHDSANKPIQGIHLAGLFASGEYCNTAITNEEGEGVLVWNNAQTVIERLRLNDEEFVGPFSENSSIVLTLKSKN